MQSYKTRIHQRALSKGMHALSDVELLTLLFGGGRASDLSNLLEKVNFDLPSLARLNYQELCRTPGIGLSRALSLDSAWELGRRRACAVTVDRPAVRCSNDAYQLLKSELHDLVHEEFWILLLDRSHRLILKRQVSKGGVSGTVVDPRLIYKWGVAHLASAVIVAHNHPSGQLKPSASDLRLTDKLKHAGEFLEIPLLDHLILNGEGYLSFSDEQMLNN